MTSPNIMLKKHPASPENVARAEAFAHQYNASMRHDSDGDGRRMDVAETMSLALQLESMRARVWETKYPPIKARSYIPVASEDDPGADTVAYEVEEEQGQAKIITNGANDLPNVTTSNRKVTRPIVSVGVAFHYTLQDIRRAAFMGKPLSARRAIAARRASDRRLETLAASGATTEGIVGGLLNTAGVGIEPLAAAGTWATKVAGAAGPPAVLNDLNKLVASVITASAEAHVPDTVLLPTAQMLLISQTRLSADSDDTILQAFLRANPWIQTVDMWNVLQGAGAGPSDRAIAYHRDPENLELVIPQEWEMLPPQARGLSFEVPTHLRTAGTTIMRPLSIRYMDGI